MSLLNRGILSTLCVAMSLAAGCYTEEPIELTGFLFGPSTQTLAAMAEDPRDADMRREGIAKLSERSFGKTEPFLNLCERYLAGRPDPDPLVRGAAARALGNAGDPQYIPALVKGLRDPDALVRVDAAVALDDLPGPEALEPLMAATKNDEAASVRASCAMALRHYDDLDTVGALVNCLDDEAFSVRYRAREALVEVTGHDRGYHRPDWESIASGETPFVAPDEDNPWWDPLGWIE